MKTCYEMLAKNSFGLKQSVIKVLLKYQSSNLIDHEKTNWKWKNCGFDNNVCYIHFSMR